MPYRSSFRVNAHTIALDQPTYFIADIGSNHDGDLDRAKALIWQAKEAGADAAKFQHFLANKIVSDRGFKALGTALGHQTAWDKSVYEVYEHYETNRDWTDALVETAQEAGIDFMTTPYDAEAVETIARHVPAFKIGSGDITWIDAVEHIARQGKPVFLATGAASMSDVQRAVDAVLKHNAQLCLMQCNTNYTGDLTNLHHVNLRVLHTYAARYPDMPLGLSDHTPGHATVLGAVALGARAVEKHFTDDQSRTGPDHGFSMPPTTWREMVDRTRELEAALGDGIKRIEENEIESAVIQRRCLRLTRPLSPGDLITDDMLESLRPAPEGSLNPYQVDNILGRTVTVAKEAGDALMAHEIADLPQRARA